jgi:hypothetical protein
LQFRIYQVVHIGGDRHAFVCTKVRCLKLNLKTFIPAQMHGALFKCVKVISGGTEGATKLAFDRA